MFKISFPSGLYITGVGIGCFLGLKIYPFRVILDPNLPLWGSAPLCSDATPSCSRPLHLRSACLRSRTPASVRTVGDIWYHIALLPLINDEWEPLGFPLLNYLLNYSMMMSPFSSIVNPSPNSPFSYIL